MNAEIKKAVSLKPFGFAAAAFLLTLPLIALNDLPARDVAFRYLPMTESILSGNWDTAFHPRIPFLFPVLASVPAWIFSCSAFSALKLTGAFFFAASFFPLWHIFRNVFDEKTADFGCAAALLGSGLLRLGAGAMREDLKLFFFLVCVSGLLSLFRDPRSPGAMLLLAASAALMSLTRDDSILIAAVFALTALVLEVRATHRFPWRFGCGLLTGLLLILPQLAVNTCMTGYPVMSSRFLPATKTCLPARWFDPIRCSALPRFPETGKAEKTLPPPGPAVPSASETVREPAAPGKTGLDRAGDFLSSLLRGLLWPLALTAVPAMLIRLKKKKWTDGETVLFCCWAGHTLLILAQIAAEGKFFSVSARYLLPAAPLVCGWTALTVSGLYHAAEKHVRPALLRPLSAGSLLLCAGVFWFEAAKPEIRSRFTPDGREKRTALFRMADAVRKDSRDLPPYAEKVFRMSEYRSFRRPEIRTGDSDFARLACLTGGSPASGPRADYIAESIPSGCGIPARQEGYILLLSVPGKTSTALLWKKRRCEP